jgi:hypothetical protein
MAKGSVFQNPSGALQPLQSGINSLFSGPAGARPDPMDFMRKPTSGIQTQTGAMRGLREIPLYATGGSGMHPGKESGYGITRFDPSGGWDFDPMANKDRYKPPTIDSAAHKRAEDHWLRMKELDAQKQKIFSDLTAYGNKDLSPAAPSHSYVGESPGEYEPHDSGLSDTYIDILNPSKYANYDEFERERDNMFTYSGSV